MKTVRRIFLRREGGRGSIESTIPRIVSGPPGRGQGKTGGGARTADRRASISANFGDRPAVTLPGGPHGWSFTDGPSSRREFLRVGALSLGGLTLPQLLAARAAGPPEG